MGMKYQKKMLRNFALLHGPTFSGWKLPGRGGVLRGEIFGGGIYNGGRFKSKIPIVLISIMDGQEGTLLYFNTVIKSGVVH